MTSLLIIAAIGQSCIQQQVAYQPVQYQQAYNQAYIEKTIFVAVENAQDYYAGLVGQQQRAQSRADQVQQVQSGVDAKLDRLTTLVEQLQRRIDASEPPIPSKPAASPVEPARPALPALATPASEAAPLPPTVAQASASLTARKGITPGLALLVSKCGTCHTGAAQKGGGHILFAADGSFAVRDRDLLERIETAIASGSMPKGKQQQLTLREYVSIRDYLNEQASSLALNTTNLPKRR